MLEQFEKLLALTIAITGFNQEDIIRGSIESVLNQVYFLR